MASPDANSSPAVRAASLPKLREKDKTFILEFLAARSLSKLNVLSLLPSSIHIISQSLEIELRWGVILVKKWSSDSSSLKNGVTIESLNFLFFASISEIFNSKITVYSIAMHKDKINQIFARFAENKPDPKIELDYKTPYELLVAVVLSAQSTDKGVNRVTPKLFEVAPTPQKMVELGLDNLKEYIKTIGLYNNKAKNIIALSELLVKRFDGEVPSDFEQLCSLPGVGRKSANVMLNSIWGVPTIAVDTHVFRVSNRIGLCKTTTPEKTEEALLKVVPAQWRPKAHHWLVLHGRYTCKAIKPECAKCLINDICKYRDKKM